MAVTSTIPASSVGGSTRVAFNPVLDSFPANIAYVDHEKVYRYVNTRYESLFSCRRADIVGRRVADVFGPEEYRVIADRLDMALAGEALSYDAQFHFPDREPCWLTVHYIPDLSPAGGVQGLYVVAVDVSRARLAERGLLESEARFRTLYETAPIGIAHYDRECRLLHINQKAAAELAVAPEQLVGRTLTEILGVESGTEFERRQRKVVADGLPQEHIDAVDLPGGAKWFLSSYSMVPGPDGRALGVQIVSRDITALKRAEQEKLEAENRLRLAQKLEAVGALAGGVAHDFNNILQTILSFSGEILADEGTSAQHREDLKVVRDACRRGAALTQQLLAFGRQQVLEPAPVDANKVVGAVVKLIRRLIGEHIALDVRLQAVRSQVVADEGQLSQILLNLAVNARDAMVDTGTLTIATGNRTVTVAGAGCRPELPPGDYLTITVRDDGCGMIPEVLDRVFEPFFTTKPFGKGTGLGLATVFGIVEQHGGCIHATSRPGDGSQFEICLPLRGKSEGTRSEPALPVARGRAETILLAEDDADILGLLERQLRRCGYRVLTARDGSEAMEAHRRNPGGIDLAVLDLAMPVCSGLQAFEAMRAADPGLQVLFMSGNPEYRGSAAKDWDPALPLLRKPFTGEDLCREIRRHLDLARAGV